MRGRRRHIWVALWLVMSAVLPTPLAAEAPATQASGDDQPTISLNFPENVDLKTLVDYVSQRLSLNIVYQDEQLANQRVTIKAPTRIPVSALKGLLESLLKMRGLTIVDADQPGWKRISPIPGSAVPATQPIGGGEQVVTQAFALQFVDAQRMDAVLKPFLSGPAATSFGIPEQHVVLVTDFASNLKRVGEIVAMVDQLNRNQEIGFIPVHNADAAQLAQQLKQILTARAKAQAAPGQSGENVEVAQDRRTGQLMVIGPKGLVEEARRAVKALDVAVAEQQSPIRFYKLANATAADVLETIRALEGEPSSGQPPQAPSSRRPAGFSAGLSAGTPGTGAGSTIASPQMLTPARIGSGLAGGAISSPYGQENSADLAAAPPAPQQRQSNVASEPTAAAATGLRTRNATVAADANTNTTIVIAEPAVQQLYEQIIRTLDKRRPQVLLEATIVTLDTSHGYSFGVDFSGRTKGGKDQAISFSSFGLSTPDPASGHLTLVPGVGFNGAVIASDVAQVILHALAQSSRAKVSSAPRILVNDNATGDLSSLTEEPFTTTAIGNTIATTTFGGYAQAGTTVTLTPHISQSDYLQLEYSVTLSSFTGAGSAGIPPPIEQNTVESKVTIPDGSTVIVGGLNRTNYTKSVNAIPILGEIPFLRYLVSQRNMNEQTITLFVFLRPIILRDDQFEDLKFLSERDLKAAEVPAGMPHSDPLPIR